MLGSAQQHSRLGLAAITRFILAMRAYANVVDRQSVQETLVHLGQDIGCDDPLAHVRLVADDDQREPPRLELRKCLERILVETIVLKRRWRIAAAISKLR